MYTSTTIWRIFWLSDVYLHNNLTNILVVKCIPPQQSDEYSGCQMYTSTTIWRIFWLSNVYLHNNLTNILVVKCIPPQQSDEYSGCQMYTSTTIWRISWLSNVYLHNNLTNILVLKCIPPQQSDEYSGCQMYTSTTIWRIFWLSNVYLHNNLTNILVVKCIHNNLTLIKYNWHKKWLKTKERNQIVLNNLSYQSQSTTNKRRPRRKLSLKFVFRPLKLKHHINNYLWFTCIDCKKQVSFSHFLHKSIVYVWNIP